MPFKIGKRYKQSDSGALVAVGYFVFWRNPDNPKHIRIIPHSDFDLVEYHAECDAWMAACLMRNELNKQEAQSNG